MNGSSRSSESCSSFTGREPSWPQRSRRFRFLLPARGAFEAVDPALEDVARLLGRNEASVFWEVTVPLAWRGLAAGAVLAFASPRRLRRHDDGGWQHSGIHPDRGAGHLRLPCRQATLSEQPG